MSEETPKKIKPIPILLDEPVGHTEDTRAELGFEEYADVLAGVILGSDSPFTVGIFGDWGTGKTTLMRCIERKLNSPDHWEIEDPKPTIVPVWFEAWRYEREEDLIAPLLGEIFDAIERKKDEAGLRGQAKTALVAAGKRFHALFRSLARASSFKLGLPKVVEWTFEGGDACEKYDEFLEGLKLPGSSDYREAYRLLRDALGDFAGDGKAQSKIVVFVDDLDRCLPEPAVEVLEATKVFLGFEGMVFVLGLKREIIERCIERRYCRTEDGQDEPPHDDDLGRKYVDKLVQVPFTVPVGGPEQIADFVKWLTERDDFPEELAGDYEPMSPADECEHDKLYAAFDVAHQRGTAVQRRYALIIEHLAPVPRTAKRAVNAYSVAAHIAMDSLDEGDFDPDIMAALVTLQFLAPEVYRELTSRPESARSRLFARAAMALGLERDLPRQFTDTINHGPLPIRDSAEDAPALEAESEDDLRTALRRRWGSPIGWRAARFLLHTRLLEGDADAIKRHARVATAAVSSPKDLARRLFLSSGLLREPRAVAQLLNDERVAQTAATDLLRLGRHAVPCLTEVLAIGEDVAVQWAAELLGTLGGAEVVPALIDALGHPEPLVRAHAASALGEIGPAAEAALPALRELREGDPSIDVQDAAGFAIAAIEPSPPPPPPF